MSHQRRYVSPKSDWNCAPNSQTDWNGSVCHMTTSAIAVANPAIMELMIQFVLMPNGSVIRYKRMNVRTTSPPASAACRKPESDESFDANMAVSRLSYSTYASPAARESASGRATPERRASPAAIAASARKIIQSMDMCARDWVTASMLDFVSECNELRKSYTHLNFCLEI